MFRLKPEHTGSKVLPSKKCPREGSNAAKFYILSFDLTKGGQVFWFQHCGSSLCSRLTKGF